MVSANENPQRLLVFSFYTFLIKSKRIVSIFFLPFVICIRCVVSVGKHFMLPVKYTECNASLWTETGVHLAYLRLSVCT